MSAFLPLGFEGDPADLAAALAQTGGNLDFTLTDAEARKPVGLERRNLFGDRQRARTISEAVSKAISTPLYLRNRGRNFS